MVAATIPTLKEMDVAIKQVEMGLQESSARQEIDVLHEGVSSIGD